MKLVVRAHILRGFGIFVLSFLVGTTYTVLIGLIDIPLRALLIAWPVWIGVFWFLFWKFNLLRFTGFIAVLPVSILAFEMLWSVTHPGMNADQHSAFDHSHYTPGLRVKNPVVYEARPDGRGSGLKEILIGKDGFRADPDTGKGNPERCQFVLIGDSMIYGTGMPYPFTFGPVLASMGTRACVFGVSNNSPADYLATFKYVADRIEPGAHVAFYLYAYNDFVGHHKYFRRRLDSLSNSFPKLFKWARYFDRWRQATFVYSLFRVEQVVRTRKTLWQYDIGKVEPIKIHYAGDPAKYVSPKHLNNRQRVALQLFFSEVGEFARNRPRHISILIHPDDAEIYANFARRSPVFADLDPRRADALRICEEYNFLCEDISRHIYERSWAEGKNPYFIDNRHFSAFGTRIVAEHFVAFAKRVAAPTRTATAAPD